MADPFYLGNQEKEIRDRWQKQLQAAAWPPPDVTQCRSSAEPPQPRVDLANAAVYLDNAIREAFVAGAAYHASINPAPHIVIIEPAPPAGMSLDMGTPEGNKILAAHLQALAAEAEHKTGKAPTP